MICGAHAWSGCLCLLEKRGGKGFCEVVGRAWAVTKEMKCVWPVLACSVAESRRSCLCPECVLELAKCTAAILGHSKPFLWGMLNPRRDGSTSRKQWKARGVCWRSLDTQTALCYIRLQRQQLSPSSIISHAWQRAKPLPPWPDSSAFVQVYIGNALSMHRSSCYDTS